MPCTYMYACKTRGNPCLYQSLAFASGASGADRGMMQLHRVRTEWSSALPSAGSDANFARSTARDLRWYFCGPPTACVHTLPFGLHMPKKEGGRRRNGNKEMNEKTKTKKKQTIHSMGVRYVYTHAGNTRAQGYSLWHSKCSGGMVYIPCYFPCTAIKSEPNSKSTLM